MRYRTPFPYTVVIEHDHRKYAYTFRAYSPRHALCLAERAIREPDWQANWTLVPTPATQEVQS